MAIYLGNQKSNIFSGFKEDTDIGTFNITSNGIFDISEYAFAFINVENKNYYAGNYTPDDNFGEEGELYFVVGE